MTHLTHRGAAREIDMDKSEKMNKNQKTLMEMFVHALKLAKKHFIFDAGLGRVELIRRIQLEEGQLDCYAKAPQGSCYQSGCLWSETCPLDAAKHDYSGSGSPAPAILRPRSAELGDSHRRH